MTSIGPPNNAPLPSSFDEDYDFYNENGLEKIWRRLKEEPLIPLGVGMTVWAIVGATRSMQRGNHQQTNLFFRRRLYAQTFTIAVMCAGHYTYKEDRQKRKEREKEAKEQEKLARRDRWLKELEARDEEEKAYQEKLKRRRKEIADGREDAKGITQMVAEKTKELKDQANRE